MDTRTVLISIDFGDFYSFVSSSFNDQFEKLYQTLERVFHQVSKHLELG